MHRFIRYLVIAAAVIGFIVFGRVHSVIPAQETGAGTLIAETRAPEAEKLFVHGIAKAIGFDGSFLYYTEYAGSTLHRIDVPAPGTSMARGHIDIPIAGAPSGIMAISYDVNRNAFWAVGGDGLSMLPPQ